MNLIDVLQSCRLFSQVHAAGFQRLVTMGRLVKFEKGESIFRDGQPCPGVYVVGNGLVRVFKVGPGGKEHVLHIVGPGETFAEVAAVGGLPCPAHAEAIAATTCAMLPLEPFRQLMHQDHQFCLDMMAGLTVWVRHLVALMEDLVLRDATGRLARYLLDADPGTGGLIELPTLKRHVASHLNLTSETFSRTIRRLHEAGLIDQPDSIRIQLVDRDGLRRAAEGNMPRVGDES